MLKDFDRLKFENAEDIEKVYAGWCNVPHVTAFNASAQELYPWFRCVWHILAPTVPRSEPLLFFSLGIHEGNSVFPEAQRNQWSEVRGVKDGRSNKGRRTPTKNSHKSNTVRGVGCEEQEKTWMVVWGTNPQDASFMKIWPFLRWDGGGGLHIGNWDRALKVLHGLHLLLW